MTQNQRLAGSFRQIAEALGVDRSVLSRIVKDRGIKPASGKGVRATFFVRDLADAIRDADPARESPFQQLARVKAARERIKLQQEAGQLIPREECRAGYAAAFKELARTLDTIPDVLERDCGASAAMLMRTEREIDRLRDDLYRRLVAAEGQGAQESPAAAVRELVAPVQAN